MLGLESEMPPSAHILSTSFLISIAVKLLRNETCSINEGS